LIFTRHCTEEEVGVRSYEGNMKLILELLLSSPEFMTLEALSVRVGVSKRSIQNYMSKVENWLEENALKETTLIRKQGLGIRLESSLSDRQKMEHLLGYQHLNIYSGDAKRRMEILKSLIFSEDEITIQNLVGQFYVSRSTILSDLDWASQWLAQYKLKLYKTQHRGVDIIGDEVAHRNAIAGFFNTYESGVISDFIAPQILSRVNEKTLQKLTTAYPRDLVLKIGKIIENAEHAFDFILLDDFFVSLLTHMVIAILRIKSGKSMPKEFLPTDEVFPPLETKTAEFIAMRIRKVLGIELSAAEKAYICIHLIGYNAFSWEQDCTPFPQKIEHLAISLIDAVDLSLHTNYAHDKMLFFGLCLHLKTAVYRLKVETHSTKSHGAELPENWMDAYNAVRAASGLYEQICGVAPDHEELLSITYFFLLSHRRYTNRIKTLLVSNLGILIRMRLMDELEQELPQLEIVDSCSSQQFSDWQNQHYALVITTDLLERCDKQLVDLSQTPRGEYRQAIESYIQREFLFWQP
jgi:mannitol operon transcriptional antiterminator